MIRAFWREVAFLALFVIAVVILVWLFAHLNNKTPDASENPQRFRIESGGSNVGVALVTDRDTGVQYLMNTRTGGFTVLVDKDGKPIVANGWRDYD